MKWLKIALLIVSVFAPTVFAQTVEEPTASPNCIEIISGTERHLQCENVSTPTAEQTGENSLPGRKGGKTQAKRLTPQQRNAGATSAKARTVRGMQMQIRDFEDSSEGPIVSVAR